MFVDDRIGSVELCKPLRTLGCPAKVKRLAYADCAFRGRGPHASTVAIGIERKTVSEILTAMRDAHGRFTGHQLPGLLRRYDYVYLVVEGDSFIAADGILALGGYTPNRTMYESYKRYLISLAVKGTLFVECTSNKRETVHFLHALYGWWQKPYASHKSIFKVEAVAPDAAILDERTVRRQTFAQFPGVGWERSKRVSKAFPSIAAAVNATEDEWMRALGIAKGRKIVRTLMQTLHGTGDRHAAKGV